MRLVYLAFSVAVLFSQGAHARLANSYDDVKRFDANLAAQYSNVQVITIGQSDSGEPIQGLKIGNGPVKNMIVSTHHGNEYGSTEVALAFAESIAKNPIAGQTVYVIPVLNISGYNHGNREEYAAADGSYHDPNRDYPGPCGTEGPFKLKSTYDLAQFVARENIVTSATLHTYYPAVVYPWGISTHDLTTPYQDIFENLVKTATEQSHYQIGNSTDVIYPADGAYEDYAFWQHGIWSILFELGESHYPSDKDLQRMAEVNVPGIRHMLETAPTTRATDHAFHGRCDVALKFLDRHDE